MSRGVSLPGFRVVITGAPVRVQSPKGGVAGEYEPISIMGRLYFQSWTVGSRPDYPGIHDSAEQARRYLTGEYLEDHKGV